MQSLCAAAAGAGSSSSIAGAQRSSSVVMRREKREPVGWHKPRPDPPRKRHGMVAVFMRG